jgi:hypothetical protein
VKSEFYPRSDVMRTHDLDLKISMRHLLILVASFIQHLQPSYLSLEVYGI